MNMCERCERQLTDLDPVLCLHGKVMCIVCAGQSLYPRLNGDNIRTIPFWPLSGSTVGLEIEGNWTPEAMATLLGVQCGIKDDGSLRGYDAAEIVSPVLSGARYLEWLKSIPWNGLTMNNRCGIHVWIGTNHYSWSDLNKLLYYCKHNERHIVNIVSPTRKLCLQRDAGGRPMIIQWEPRLYSTKDGFLDSLYGQHGHALYAGNNRSRMEANKRANDRELNHYPGPINRTWWLNVHGHWHRRAVEIRLLHTTNCMETVYAFIEFWLRIVEKVPDMSRRQLLSVKPLDMQSSLIRNVFNRRRFQYATNDALPFRPITEDGLYRKIGTSRLFVNNIEEEDV